MRAWLLAALLGTASLAAATTAPSLSLEQQAKKAEVIVRAKLGPAAEVKVGELVYAVYPLTVTETIAGDPAWLPQHEGAPALFILKDLADLPTLAAGQDVVALLYTARLDSPFVGFNQGLYAVTDGAVKAGTITDPVKLREAILSARGQK